MFRKTLFMLSALVIAGGSANAGTLDLTALDSSGSFTAGTDLFVQIDPQSTGTGVIYSFVRVGDNDDLVDGYNTDARPLEFDENSSPIFTRELLLSAVPIVTIDGVDYRQFLLDINQTGEDSLLSLDELQVFLGTSDDLTGAVVGAGGTLSFTNPGGTATLIYDMDSSGTNAVLLDYNNNTGSGSGDMFFYLADSLFTGADSQYVTLYSLFGATGDYGNNDGFEEWAVLQGSTTGGTPVPEPASLLLLGTGLAYAARKFRKSPRG